MTPADVEPEEADGSTREAVDTCYEGRWEAWLGSPRLVVLLMETARRRLEEHLGVPAAEVKFELTLARPKGFESYLNCDAFLSRVTPEGLAKFSSFAATTEAGGSTVRFELIRPTGSFSQRASSGHARLTLEVPRGSAGEALSTELAQIANRGHRWWWGPATYPKPQPRSHPAARVREWLEAIPESFRVFALGAALGIAAIWAAVTLVPDLSPPAALMIPALGIFVAGYSLVFAEFVPSVEITDGSGRLEGMLRWTVLGTVGFLLSQILGSI